MHGLVVFAGRDGTWSGSHVTLIVRRFHEMGHGIGIPHHRVPETGDETNQSRESGVSSCAMRYETRNDFMHPGFVSMDRYCRGGETWRTAVKDESGTTDIKPIEYTESDSHDCFGWINVKGD